MTLLTVPAQVQAVHAAVLAQSTGSDPVSPIWVIIALAGALIVAYGLKRFADHVLTKRDGCRLEGEQ
jgi:hypothetical protein